MNLTLNVNVLSTDAFFFFFFKRNVFRLNMKEEILGASLRGLGMEIQVTGYMYDKVRFPCLLSLMRVTAMRPAECREREGS